MRRFYHGNGMWMYWFGNHHLGFAIRLFSDSRSFCYDTYIMGGWVQWGHLHLCWWTEFNGEP